FFGVEGGKGDNFGKGKVPTYGEDYTKVDVRGQELQNRRLFGEHSTNIKPLEMKKGGKIKKANLGEIVKKLGGVEGISNTTGQLLGGLQLLKQDQNNLSQAEQLLQLSKLVGEAASLQPDLPTRRYVRPEDNPI